MRPGATALLALVVLVPARAAAHHGVATLGAAGLEGPGAPIETSSSATLPAGAVLAYLKLDYASFDTFTSARDAEGDHNAFWMFGLGYGVTPYLSAYLFVPYNDKVVEDNSYNTSGFADIALLGVVGFKYDEGVRLVPRSESLDDLEDWHFTVYGGVSLPTGNANLRTADGTIDPGRSLGFGTPAFSAGATISKAVSDRLTVVGETSYTYFQEYGYADGTRRQFGDELRLNAALCYRLFTSAEKQLRLDANMELNYLHLARDETNGIDEPATGGDILYLVPGVRAYWRNVSIGTGVKVPSVTDLNEESDQQGAEGREDYRLIFTLSALF